jgi:hypothetical protein
LTLLRTRFVADRPHPTTRNHLARFWQVGEGLSPTLDAPFILNTERLVCQKERSSATQAYHHQQVMRRTPTIGLVRRSIALAEAAVSPLARHFSTTQEQNGAPCLDLARRFPPPSKLNRSSAPRPSHIAVGPLAGCYVAG